MTTRDDNEPAVLADGVERERLVLRPVGELDYFSARNLLDALKRHLASYHTQIVLDLTSLSFCDSSGVLLASSIGSLAADRGIGFELRRSNNQAGRVFDLLST
ncbi:MAG: STAS domain-containing protein [Acidimicrobiia bacterium]|nr:STAS domain-containing protein [Acidimicrobiia bacterium]